MAFSRFLVESRGSRLLAPFFVVAFHLVANVPPIDAAVYYVRSDGGSAAQCTGTSNLPYAGTGTNAPCAWDHPFRALPPGGSPRISGGDTLMVASGSYMMGFGAPETGNCDAGGSWGCWMPPVPSGPTSANPTRIVGDCSRRPELWGTERAELVVNLNGSSNVELACFEITDHSSCVEFHSGGLACQRDTAPYGPWASRGIYAADSSNVTLRDLNIHGLSAAGIHAGRLRDWTVTNVRIAANGMVGWDGDIDGDDWNEGVMRFSHWKVEWNGCAETYPGGKPTGCWAQEAGGYGDGVGTGATHGRWIIEDSSFLYNTSDGLDLLYVRPGGSTEVRRTVARGNAGNQIKTSGPALIENSLIVGNCGWFDGNPVSHNVDNCRANGNAVSITFFRGDRVSLINTTIASEGDCTMIAGCAPDGGCDGSERLSLRNNILIGTEEFLDRTDRSCDLFAEGIGIDADYMIVFGAKINQCGALHDRCDTDPLVVRVAIDDFDGTLKRGSPAIDAAERASATTVDVDGTIRDSRPDIGAYEYVQPGTRTRAVRRK